MEKLFDTHAHYDDSKFLSMEISREEFLKTRFETDTALVLSAAVTLDSARENISLAEHFDGYYVAVGIHPCDLSKYKHDDPDRVVDELSRLLDHKKVVAIGEIGLDFYWEENEPADIQLMWLEKQLCLAEKKVYPVVIHSRDAMGATFDVISRHPNVRGVMHSFSGSVEMAREYIKRGFYISVSGVVTFKNAAKLPEVVRMLPEDRILLETDAPYLAPVPFRGKLNHSGLARYTAEKIAEIRNVSTDEIIALTRENGKRLFGIK